MQQFRRFALFLAYVVVAGLALAACATNEPLPQPRKVVNPSAIQGSMKTEGWDIAAVAYQYYDQGMDYSKAGLAPAFLVVKSKGVHTPRVLYEETRGLSPSGEYLPYNLAEATRLVQNSESFSSSAGQAARSGGMATVLGAGLGALLGTIGGGDNIWRGAAIGGAAGAMAGSTAGVYQTQESLRGDIRNELQRYIWTSDPLPPSYTKVGYLYFPAGVGVNGVSVTVREGSEVATYTVPLVSAEAAK